MSLDFKLANIFGTVYSQGNVIFTPDGNSVLSPVGNRVSVFDLVNNRSYTFAYEHRKNISRIAINDRTTLLISVDEDGRAILVNFPRKVVLHHMNFKDKVGAIEFSPDGAHIAVAAGRTVQIWRTPTAEDDRQFAPFVRHRVYKGHFGNITSLVWSPDGRFLLTGSKDMSAHIYSLQSEDSDAASRLSGHRDAVVGAFFSQDQETIYTLSRDGAQLQWNYSDDDDRWVITERHYFNMPAKVRCGAFHPSTNLLVVGFTSGIFGLYELPGFTLIQNLSVSQNAVDYVAINRSGEWLVMGASKLGQLLVWEWQSESYVLKQQSHYDSLNCLQYSPDGTKVITGADDGKIKVWDTNSGFCIVTFTQHQAAITSLTFSKRGNVFFSASLDGSIRAWDLLRYRNFRTLTAPSRLQFTSLAVDPSGELVCAGSLNDFNIHIWNLQTSQLVDQLSGHEGPVSALEFSPDGAYLLSGSWDHTLRLWNFFGRSAVSEPMQLYSEILSISFHPTGNSFAASSIDGLLTFWDSKMCSQVGEIDGKRDIIGGRYAMDRFQAKNSARAKHFTNICFNGDGSAILAGGNSKYVCFYDVQNHVLLRKFVLSKNMALEGTVEIRNSKNMTEGGIPIEAIDQDAENSDIEERVDTSLPGALRGDHSKRRVRPEIRSSGVQFSPVSASFSVASTEGLLVYAVDQKVEFDPVDLATDITIDSCVELLSKGEYLSALVLAFRLGDATVLERAYQSVPVEDIPIVASNFPEVYLDRLLTLIATEGEETPHFEFSLRWCKAILEHHGRYISRARQSLAPALRAVQKFLIGGKSVVDIAQSNVYRTEVLQHTPSA